MNGLKRNHLSTSCDCIQAILLETSRDLYLSIVEDVVANRLIVAVSQPSFQQS